ncbi:7744_t:CDS:2 [Entrophospora sp. SA101]|nr:7744_t:CDS:2 [Entrophospora sp. SA101]
MSYSGVEEGLLRSGRPKLRVLITNNSMSNQQKIVLIREEDGLTMNWPFKFDVSIFTLSTKVILFLFSILGTNRSL